MFVGRRRSSPPGRVSAVSARPGSSAASRGFVRRAPPSTTRLPSIGHWPLISVVARDGRPSQRLGPWPLVAPARSVARSRSASNCAMVVISMPHRDAPRSRVTARSESRRRWRWAAAGSPRTRHRPVHLWRCPGPMPDRSRIPPAGQWLDRCRRRESWPGRSKDAMGQLTRLRRSSFLLARGISLFAPAGSSLRISRPMPPGVSPAASRPPRWPTAVRSAASSRRWWVTLPVDSPTNMVRRCGRCSRVKTWFVSDRNARRSPRHCAPMEPA